MYDFLKVSEKEDFEYIPTVALQLQKRRILDKNSARLMHELAKDYYEKPELITGEMKVRLSFKELVERMEDKLQNYKTLAEKIKILSYYYDGFKKKKYIRIETEAGKIARVEKYPEAYVVLTPLGIETFLNLDKKEIVLENKQQREFRRDFASFVSDENMAHIEKDLEKIIKTMDELFEEIKPNLIKKYQAHYEGFVREIDSLIGLSRKEQSDYLETFSGSELYHFAWRVLRRNYDNDILEYKYTQDELQNYIGKVIENRVEEDRVDFVHKLAYKLTCIIKGRGFEVDASINSALESEMKITLSDGARFTIQTKFVDVVNQYGTYFIRQPSTFHDVYNAEGNRLKWVSYQMLVEEL